MQYNLYVQDGWTALHVACEDGHDDTVKILMRAKADLNLQTNVSNYFWLLIYGERIWIFHVLSYLMYDHKYS